VAFKESTGGMWTVSSSYSPPLSSMSLGRGPASGKLLRQRPAHSFRRRFLDTPSIWCCIISHQLRLRSHATAVHRSYPETRRVARWITAISSFSPVHSRALGVHHSGILPSEATKLGEPVNHPPRGYPRRARALGVHHSGILPSEATKLGEPVNHPPRGYPRRARPTLPTRVAFSVVGRSRDRLVRLSSPASGTQRATSSLSRDIGRAWGLPT